MDGWVLVCADCRMRVRTTRPEATRRKACPRCGAALMWAGILPLLHRDAKSQPAEPAVTRTPRGWRMRALLLSLAALALLWTSPPDAETRSGVAERHDRPIAI